MLEPQVGDFSWDRAPPEVVTNAGSLWPSLALSGSLWLVAVRLTLARCPALSGTLWLSLWPSLALSGSLWLALQLSLAPSGPLWLSQALSDSLLLSKFAYKALGSQGPCLARNVVPEFQHFN